MYYDNLLLHLHLPVLPPPTFIRLFHRNCPMLRIIDGWKRAALSVTSLSGC